MYRSTLCYIRCNNRILMLFRDKKEADINKGKWIGVGGKFKDGEQAGNCLRREVREETGLEPASFAFRGIILFRDIPEDGCEVCEEMYLYTADISEEEASHICSCDEGTLRFIPEDEIMDLPLWEGDRVFLRDILEGRKRISYELTYKKGKLADVKKTGVRNVIFDLDGTVSDSGEGIMRSAAYALNAFGFEVSDYRELSFFVGPPLLYTFTKMYGVSEDKARKMIEKYRERYNDIGAYENELYPGVKECLIKLREEGYTIALGSSKPEHMCRKILEHFGILDLFDEVTGSTPDGAIDSKSEVLCELIRRRGDDPRFLAESVLVGDTHFDVDGAMDIGMSCIGVSFGYGEAGELKDLGAVAVADSFEEIYDIVTGL